MLTFPQKKQDPTSEASQRQQLQDLITASPSEREKLLATQAYLQRVMRALGDLIEHENVYRAQMHVCIHEVDGFDMVCANHHHFRMLVLNVIRAYPCLVDHHDSRIEKEHLFDNIKQLEKYSALIEEFAAVSWVQTDADLFGQLVIAYLDAIVQLVQNTGRLNTLKPLNANNFEAHISYMDQRKYLEWGIEVLNKAMPVLNLILNKNQVNATSHEQFSQAFLEDLKPYLYTIMTGGLKLHTMQAVTSVAFMDKSLLTKHVKEAQSFIEQLKAHKESIARYADKPVSGLIKELVQKQQSINRLSALTIEPSKSDIWMRCIYQIMTSMSEASQVESQPSIQDLMNRIEAIENQLNQKGSLSPKIVDFKQDIQWVFRALEAQPDFKQALALVTLIKSWVKVLIQLEQKNSCYYELCFEKMYELELRLSRPLCQLVSQEFITANTQDLKSYKALLKLKSLSASDLVVWINQDETPTSNKTQPKSSGRTKKKRAKNKSKSNQPLVEKSDQKSLLTQPVQLNNQASSLSAPSWKLNENEFDEREWQQVGRHKKERQTSNHVSVVQEAFKPQELQKSPMSKSSLEDDFSKLTVSESNTTDGHEVKKPKEAFQMVLSQKDERGSLNPSDWPEITLLRRPVLFTEQQSTLPRNAGYKIPAKQLNRPFPNEAYQLMAYLEKKGHPCYVYGGYVRDDILHVPFVDIDLVVDIEEDAFNQLLPNCQKIEKVKGHLIYQFNDHISLTLAPNLDLKVFSKARLFTLNALFADKEGSLYDPLNILLSLKQPFILPIPGKDMYQAFKKDPSAIFRALRYSTHVSKIWDESIHDALIQSLPYLKEQPFGLFLHQLTELFLRGKGQLHFHLLYQLQALPHICLSKPMLSNANFNENTSLFHFIKFQLSNIDAIATQSSSLPSRLFILSLMLLPTLEAARLKSHGFKAYENEALDQSIQTVLDNFFDLYQGDISEAEQLLNTHQMFALLKNCLWPNFISFKKEVQMKAEFLQQQVPPSAFYQPYQINKVKPEQRGEAPEYFSYVLHGTTYFVPREQTEQQLTSAGHRFTNK